MRHSQNHSFPKASAGARDSGLSGSTDHQVKVTERACIACGCPLGANRAKEHVLPDWLLESLGTQDETIIHTVVNSAERTATQPRAPHVLGSFTEGRVCSGCNNGWMSQLESHAKPILESLFRNERHVSGLSELERMVLSRWCLKTAAILSHATPLGKPISIEHLRFLRSNASGMPHYLGVFSASGIPTREFGYWQRNHWPIMSPEGIANPTALLPEDRYKITVQVKNLILVTAHLPRVNSKFVLVAGLHIPLWPQDRFFPSYRIDLTMREPYDIARVVEIASDNLGALLM